MHKFLKKYPYYGVNGITATSANYIANLGKEYYSSILKSLKNVSFYRVEATVAGSDDSCVTKNSMSRQEFDAIPEILQQIYSIKALIAWLREAIKTREEMMGELTDLSINEYTHITKREPSDQYDAERKYILDAPSNTLDAEEKWDIDQRWEDLLNIENAQASRDAMQQLQRGISVVDGYNAEATTVEAFTSTGTKTNGTICTALTASRADMGAMENKIKAIYVKSTQALNPIKAEKDKQNRQIQLDWNQAKKAIEDKIESYYTGLQNDVKVYRSKKRTEISRLRIVIPEPLQALYDKLSTLK